MSKEGDVNATSESAAADLRIDFINCIGYLAKQSQDIKATLNLSDGSQQTGRFCAVDRDIEQFGLKDFNTPLGPFKSALVRTSDVTSLVLPAATLLDN